jgi:hypothetical protein
MNAFELPRPYEHLRQSSSIRFGSAVDVTCTGGCGPVKVKANAKASQVEQRSLRPDKRISKKFLRSGIDDLFGPCGFPRDQLRSIRENASVEDAQR